MLSETFLTKLRIERIALLNTDSDSLFAIRTTLQYPPLKPRLVPRVQIAHGLAQRNLASFDVF